MDTATKVAGLRRMQLELHRKGMDIMGKADTEKRALTADEQAEVKKTFTDAKQLGTKAGELEQVGGMNTYEVGEALISGMKAEGIDISGAGAIDPDTGRRREMEASGLKAEPRELNGWTKAVAEHIDGMKAAGMKTETPFAAPGAITLPPVSVVGMPRAGGTLLAEVGLTPFPGGGLPGPGQVVTPGRETSQIAQRAKSVSYLRQNVRTEAVAVWDRTSGDPKAESDYGWTSVSADASVIAHHSIVSVLDLYDFEGLDMWLQSEMITGLLRKVEDMAVTASGPEPAITGLAHFAGMRTQAATGLDDVLQAVSRALTTLQTAGYDTSSAVVLMSPTDAESARLLQNQVGTYYVGSPFQGVASQQIWGARVIVSPSVAAGTCYVGELRGNLLILERQVVNLAWGTVNDDFTHNKRRLLVEGQYATGLAQPDRLVKVTLPS